MNDRIIRFKAHPNCSHYILKEEIERIEKLGYKIISYSVVVRSRDEDEHFFFVVNGVNAE